VVRFCANIFEAEGRRYDLCARELTVPAFGAYLRSLNV